MGRAREVCVRVPASSANLGPGFDTLGLGLSLYDEIEVCVADEGVHVEVVGEGAGQVPDDESHLVVRAMRAAFGEMDVEPPGLRLTCHNEIPHARGLGSSSAAIVGGIALARALVSEGTSRLGDHAAFRLAARLEGHPDNVAPASYGGFVVCGREAGEFFAVPVAVDPRIAAVVLVPPYPLSTELARGLLPAAVPHEDAAANAGRAALLVAALSGSPEHLHLATRDRIHQDYRRTAMPETLELVDSLRRDGVAAVVSGAGPTVLALGVDGGLSSVPRSVPDGWRAVRLRLDRRGVQVV